MSIKLPLLFRHLSLIILLLVTLCLSACYTAPPTSVQPHDPLQHLNRDTVRFNDKLDKAILKPVAKGYTKIIPYVVRRSVGNFFANLQEVSIITNDILQAEPGWTLSDAWRFLINTTVGIGGLFDPARHIGLMPHHNDFGLTLNRWHIYTPYLVLPLLGPNTIGSSIAIPIDYYINPYRYLFSFRTRVILYVLEGVDKRAQLLQLEKTANSLIFDPYAFQQNTYLQFRAYLLQINKRGPDLSAPDTLAASDS